jgi:hypothetical protein
MRNGILTVIAALALGGFLIWVASTDFGKQIFAWLVILGFAVVLSASVYAVYSYLDERTVGWARLTAAIILGMSVTITVWELVTSHTMVDAIIRDANFYDKYDFW